MGDSSSVRHDSEVRTSAQWGSWLGIWLVSLLTGAALTIGLVLAWPTVLDLLIARSVSFSDLLSAGYLMSFLDAALGLGLVALFTILLMTACAVPVRWLWLRHRRMDSDGTAWLQAVVGGLVGGVSLLFARVLSLGEGPSVTREASGLMWLAAPELVAPLVLGGAGAAYLAHRRWWPTEPAWWAIVVVLSVAAVLLATAVNGLRFRDF